MEKPRHTQYLHTTVKMKGSSALRKVFKAVLRKYKKRTAINAALKTRLWRELSKRYRQLSFTYSDIDLFVGSRL